MNLIYQIPDQLYYIQNFLDRDTYKGIHNSIFKERNKINLTSSKGIWDEILIKNIIPPKRVGVSKYTPFEKLKILTKHNKFYQLKLDEINASIHYMEKGAGINWHNDASWKYGATYYLNNRWNPDWGGEFMFTGDNGHGYIPIVRNSLVIIKSPFRHKVNPVLTSIVPRISIQMFMK
tara:strand:+ start:1755 stop:2285 length:531 start_codon:yes stop_codon:yes gene_type:complete